MEDLNQRCFVIMPFGEKIDVDGSVVDFDVVYNHIIKVTLNNMNIECIRCDEIDEGGWIHPKMIRYIYESGIAIVDITSLNPNVFYELGIRHTLRQAVTVLIRRKGTDIPFNIQGLNIIEYDQFDIANVEETKKKIADFIKNGLSLYRKDSPVHEVLNLKIVTESRRLHRTKVFKYKIRNTNDKYICLITGDISNVKNVDIWVNSENTNMQMARHFDRSISSCIRYYGSKRDKAGKVIEDTVANELYEIVGDHAIVPPATVIITDSGELKKTHNVKKIFHAASVIGQVGKGYSPIHDIRMCINNSLAKAESNDLCDVDLKSILFPLMGTGTGRGKIEDKAAELIDSAISYLINNTASRIQEVFFLTWSDKELEACQRILQESKDVELA